jgi:hypothetical protein
MLGYRGMRGSRRALRLLRDIGVVADVRLSNLGVTPSEHEQLEEEH